MFLVVIGILSIVLAFPRPLVLWLREPGIVLTLAAVVTCLPALIAVVVARRAVHRLDQRPDDPGEGQFYLARGQIAIHTALAIGHGLLLLTTNWVYLCRRVPLTHATPLLASLLAVIPFLLSVLLVWIALYPADRAVRQIAIELYLFRSKPVRPVWSLRQYLTYNLRHQLLFILIPMLLILAARDGIELYQRPLERLHPFLPDLLLGLAAMAVAVIAPVVIRHVWHTHRLPDGPLRDRLLAICRRLRLRCREILVWRTGGMIVNAAVMGLVAPLRYVLITDGMLEQMDDTKIEAVFGHEAGHVKRHHITYYLLFALISGCLVTIFSVYSRQLHGVTYQAAGLVCGLLLFFQWGALFGWISRRFERQADLYGARTLAAAGVPCQRPCTLHGGRGSSSSGNPGSDVSSLAHTAPVCATAASIFGDTLNEVAHLNGIPPEARSWRHSSIASRSRFLQALALDADAPRAFERRLGWIKAAIFATALASLLWAAWSLQIWTLLAWPRSAA